MKFYQLSILIFCVFFTSCQTTSAKKTVFIKISSNDCILCNSNLDNVYNQSGDIEKTLVLKEEDKSDLDFLTSLRISSRTHTQVIFSDEMYYKYDSTERSMVYIIEGEEIKHKKLLKEITLIDLQVFFNKNYIQESSSILSKMPKRGELIDMGDFIGIFDHKKCVRNKKDQLTKIYDTINLISPKIVEAVYKTAFGNSYQEKLELYNKMQKLYGQSLAHNVKTICYNNDTLYSIININFVTMDISNAGRDTALRFDILQHMAFFNGTEYIGQMPIEDAAIMQNEQYSILPISLFIDNGEIFCNIWKETLSTNNPVVAEMKIKNGKVKFNKLTLVELPKINTENNLGYDILNTSHSGDYLCINTDNLLYDMKRNKKYAFPFYQEKNKVSDVDVKNLTPKFKSLILSIYQAQEGLNVIYTSNDSVKYAQCTFTSNGIQLSKEKRLEGKYSNGNYYFVVADKTGYYRHVKNKGIEFNLYK